MLDSGPVECRWVVGADGEKSRVREWAGLEDTRQLIAPLRIPPPLSNYAVGRLRRNLLGLRLTDLCYADRSRGNLRGCDLARLAPPAGASIAPAPGTFRQIEESHPSTTAERGAVSATRRLARVYRNNVVLVGDASGSVDAITGEGLRLGFEQGMALAKALEANDLRLYAAAHRAVGAASRFHGRSDVVARSFCVAAAARAARAFGRSGNLRYAASDARG